MKTEIKANVRLNLPSTFYEVTLKYDTFKKATYDLYLIAALAKNTKKDETEAYKYIDEITGNGSLNEHFKKIYNEKVSKLTDEQINDILKNSLFPITVIDRKNNFMYYPMLNATKIGKNVHDGNLAEQEIILKRLVMPKMEGIKFLSLVYEEKNSMSESDIYIAKFTDDTIKIDLGNKKYYEISKDDFKEIHENDIQDFSDIKNVYEFLGNVDNKITDDDWYVLSKNALESFAKEKDQIKFKDSNGIHTILNNEYMRTIEIIKVFDMFFYKENKLKYSLENKVKCEDAINYLLESKKINEFKTKTLADIIKIVNPKTAQSTIQYILDIKDSKELSRQAIDLIKSGFNEGWKIDILKSIKKYADISEYKHLYRINSNLDFEIEEILVIDEIDLTLEDKLRKEKHLAEKQKLLNDINLWIGEITNSGIREKIKSHVNTDLKKSVKKFLDVRTGHNKKNYQSMNVEQLRKEHDEIFNMYKGDYQKMLKKVEEHENSWKIFLC